MGGRNLQPPDRPVLGWRGLPQQYGTGHAQQLFRCPLSVLRRRGTHDQQSIGIDGEPGKRSQTGIGRRIDERNHPLHAGKGRRDQPDLADAVLAELQLRDGTARPTATREM